MRVCAKCGKEFPTNRNSMYCEECRYRICDYCGKRFRTKRRYQILTEKAYCSHACANKVIARQRYEGAAELAKQQYRELHKEQFGRTHKYDGYRLYYNTDLWIHGPNGDEPLYRYLYTKYIGIIPDGYVIHHKDGNHNNNCLYNLECLSRSEHLLKHNINRWGYNDPVKESDAE